MGRPKMKKDNNLIILCCSLLPRVSRNKITIDFIVLTFFSIPQIIGDQGKGVESSESASTGPFQSLHHPWVTDRSFSLQMQGGGGAVVL